MIATRPWIDLLSLLSFVTIRDYSRRFGRGQPGRENSTLGGETQNSYA
jgi:hypothetical protein